MALRFEVQTLVPRPIEEVFDHVVEPGLLSSYFTSEASGPLEPGKTVRWTWPSGETETVDVEAVERNRKVVFTWKAFRVDTRTRVTILFATPESGRTEVAIVEEGWDSDAAGTASAFEHCAGWEHMLLCLKARMAFGIDLRG
jgi:uncharacterized protein YndB with AHSA1/START domain